MKENLKIAIDCDGVLRASFEKMIELYNKNFNQTLKKEDVIDYNVDISFPEIKKQTGMTAVEWFFGIHGTEVFYKSKSFAGNDWAVDELKRYGDVTILTYQKSFFNKLDTLQWLHKEKLDTLNLCFLEDKGRLDCDIMIDDNPKYFENCKAKVCVLITAPYNKDVDLNDIAESCDCEKVLRFDSLFAFAKYFRQINGNLI